VQARKLAGHAVPTCSARRWWSWVGADQEGQRNVPAEAGIPPETGSKEHTIRGERIGMTPPIDPVSSPVRRPDQHRAALTGVEDPRA
jgi:hypothetical protein